VPTPTQDVNTACDNESDVSRVLFSLLLLFFLISGGCGLIYQVVWTRQLVTLLGTAAYAVSTVLAVFFAGLGVGGWLGGHLADRSRNPLRLYGIAEIIIGLWAALFPLLLKVTESRAVGVLQLCPDSRPYAVLTRALLSAGLLFVPVCAMGTTLPLLARYLQRHKVCGTRVAALYAVNIFGAAVACYFTGYFLVERLGFTATLWVGATLNLAVGIGAVLAARLREETPATDLRRLQNTHKISDVKEAGSNSVAYLYILAVAVSGFCVLVLEVIWTRLLSMVFLGTVYAYSTMLTVVLVGLALGAGVAAWVSDRVRSHRFTVGVAFGLASLAVWVSWVLLGRLPEAFAEAQQGSGYSWSHETWTKFLLSFTVLLPPTTVLGTIFPLTLRAATSEIQRVGRDIGRLYAVNTAAGVLGSVGTGFLFMPYLGSQTTTLGVSCVYAVTAILFLGRALDMPVKKRFLAGAALLLALGSAVIFRRDDVLEKIHRGYLPSDHRLLHFVEGTEGTVAVSEPLTETEGRNRVLWINRVQATTSIERGVRMNRFQGILPLVLDREPQDVLFMCFGSGITCGTLALHPFRRIDAVEISRDVLAVAPFFARDNLEVYRRSNVRFHIDDGRNFLVTHAGPYDVITFEPMPLAVAGVSSFYTREFYTLCRSGLTSDGVVSQWIPLHSSSVELVRGLVRTFVEVFPYTSGWFINADMFLLGSQRPLRVDLRRLEARLQNPALATAAAEAWFPDALEVAACFAWDDAALRAFAEGARIMRDDLPYAEYEAPRNVYARSVPPLLEASAPYSFDPLPHLVRTEGDAERVEAFRRRWEAHRNDVSALKSYYGGMAIGNRALDLFLASLDIDPQDANAQHYVFQILDAQIPLLLRWEERKKAREILDAVERRLPHHPRVLEWRAKGGFGTAE
jgi:spermidine synthase/MFS family permease